MAFMKYFIVAFGFFASGLMWWKILTTPDIPWPVFQGVVYSLVMAMFVWMALGFPAINFKKNQNTYVTRNYSITAVKSTSNKKLALIVIASILVFALIIGSILCFIWLMSADSKIQATPEEIWLVIQEQGYEPEDITETYYTNDIDAFLCLNKCIAFKKDDIEFQFLDFNNRDSATDFWGTIYQKITIQYNAINKIETEYYVANYRIYTLDSLGKYNVAIYVGNTAVYAYCNSENKNEINKILAKIDYLEFGNNKESTS